MAGSAPAQALAAGSFPPPAQGLRRLAPLPGSASGRARRRTTARAPADYIVAVVNSEPITNNEVRAAHGRASSSSSRSRASACRRAPQFARQVLERLISEKAQLQLARETGIKVDEALVDQAEQNVARQNQLDVAELRRRLPPTASRRRSSARSCATSSLLTRLRERELESRVKVNELDVDQFLREQQRRARRRRPTEINLAHILVAVPENATEAQVATLRAKAQRRAGARPRRRGLRQAGARSSPTRRAPPPAAARSGLRSADRYPPLFVQAIAEPARGRRQRRWFARARAFTWSR